MARSGLSLEFPQTVGVFAGRLGHLNWLLLLCRRVVATASFYLFLDGVVSLPFELN